MDNQTQDMRIQAILDLWTEICSDLIVGYVIHHLIDTQIFTIKEYEDIVREGQKIGDIEDLAIRDAVLRRQSEYFLNSLIEKMPTNPVSYNCFLFILNKDGYYPWIGHKIMNRRCDLDKQKELQERLSQPLFDISSVPVFNGANHKIIDRSFYNNLFNRNEETSQVVICHDIPNAVKNLIKRTDKLNEIREYLFRFATNGKGWLVIYGMGGNGKSILASEAVRDWNATNCPHFKDGIWWTNCGQITKDLKFDETSLLIKMQLLWERISGQENIKFECLENAIHRLKTHFKKNPKSLIILDDVWEKEVIESFDIGVPVLVTTRHRNILPIHFLDSDKHSINTNHNEDYGLSFDESRQLLSLWVNCEPNELKIEQNVNKIIEKFRGHPMCLTLIGSFMEEQGNDSNAWKALYESIESDEQRSPNRRRSSSGNHRIIYDQFCFDRLVEQSYNALNEDLKHHYKYFALFLEDIRIPVEVFETIWDKPKFVVESILGEMVKKSLVMTTKKDQCTLYMVHDIILNFLKKQCNTELGNLHGELLDRYFNTCKQSDGSYKYSELPNDGYIYYFLGYHIYKSHRFELFPEIFLDLSFIMKKLQNTGPSDVLNDYYNYKDHFKDYINKYQDFLRFVSTNADLLCDLSIDVLQLALNQSNDSFVFKNAMDLVSKSDKIYLKWCNQSNIKTSKLLSTKLHSGSVKYAVFDNKGEIIASVGTDFIVRLWDSCTGKQLRSMKGHTKTINCCQISSDGAQLVTASDDGTVKLWYLQDIGGNNEFEVFSPRPRSGSEYPFMLLSSLDESADTYRGHDPDNDGSGDSQIEVKCCAISYDKNDYLVATGGTDLVIHIRKLWIHTTILILSGHTFPVTSCQFSSDSKSLISSSGDEVFVWELKRGTVIKKLKHEMNVENCVFGLKLGYIFSSSGRYVYQWGQSKNEPIQKFNNIKTAYYLTHCAVSPNGNYIAGSTTTDQVVIWVSFPNARSVGVVAHSRMAVATFKCADRIHCINFSQDSTKLLSCLEDGTVVIWDTSQTFGASRVALRKKFAVLTNKGVDLKVLTPDENGTLRLFEGIEGKENRLLALKPRQTYLEPEFPTYDITCCALSYNCDILFGTSDGKLIYHDHINSRTHYLEEHEKEVTFCEFAAQNKFVTASNDSYLRIYRKFALIYDRPKKRVKTDDGVLLTDIEFGPITDAKLFSRGHKCMVWSENGLFLLDLTNSLLLSSSQHSSHIIRADITSDERLIATASADNSITLWRWNNIDIYPIRTHSSECCPRSCRFSPDGDFLVIGHDSGIIKIWNFIGTDSKHLYKFNGQHSEWVNDIVVSPNGNLIITISKSIKLWNRSGELLQTFKTNGGSMSSIYANFVANNNNNNGESVNQIVTVDDSGLLYILEILNFC